jgi:OmpA-OmpF porin, OOP family
VKTSVTNTAVTAAAGTLNENGDFVANTGDVSAIKLNDSVSINVGNVSSEAKMVSFIKDNNVAVNKTTWFTMNGLFFETGKSVLKPSSQEQLKNLVAILNAYPNVNLKIGGYTDNTGDSSKNVALSLKRAETTKNELIALGINTSRLTAEGYGPQFPICLANDSDTCKAKNRRIDVRIVQK